MSEERNPPPTVQRKDEATAAAIAIRRFANESIYEIAHDLDAGESSTYQFLCECGNLKCNGMVELRLSEYRGHLPGSIVSHD